MRNILLGAIILFIGSFAHAQVQEVWAVPYSYNSTSRDFARAIAVDADGNIYVAGATHRTGEDYADYITVVKYNKSGAQLWVRYYGSGQINGGLKPVAMVLDAAANVYVTGSSEWGGNVFTTLKYNKDGQFRWAQRFGGVGDYHHGDAASLAVDASGNVYVTGFIYTAPFNTPDFYYFTEFVTVKYDILGEQEWVRTYNGTLPGNGINKPSAITVDGPGNIFITGQSQLDGQMDYVTLKYSPTGSRLWTARYQGPSNQDDEARAIVLDGAYNVYVTGRSTSNSQPDYLTVKYDNNGNELWTARYDGGSSDGAYAICMNQDGNVCVTGNSYVDGQSSNYGTVIYNQNGVQQWVRHFNNSGSSSEQATDIATDGDANIYVCGTSNNLIATVKYNSAGTLQWSKTYGTFDDFGGNEIQKMSVALDLTGNVYVAGEHDPPPFGGIDYADFITIRYAQCNLVCPSNISVNNDAGTCGAVVNFADVTLVGDCGGSITYSHASGSTFPVGVTTVTVTSDETGATCSFTITVNDNEPPVITCPPNATVGLNNGACYATVNPGIATATDNCTTVINGTRSDGAALTANYLLGVTTITWTATDQGNNVATCTQTITVVDNQPPAISNESVSPVALAPPNHTMRDVTVSYNATDNCSVTTSLSVTSNEPVNGIADGDTDPDWIILDNHHLQLRAERSSTGDGRIYTITITATDGTNIVTRNVEVRVAHDIVNPHSGHPFRIGSTVDFSGVFWDKPTNRHTAKWLIDNSISVKGIVTEPTANKNGKVTGSYKFNTAGVYKLQMNTTDQNGITSYANTNGDLESIVVIYDPNGGYAFGGGWFNSPMGALSSNASATGKASYGFTVNYFKNSTFPKGETQFEFKVGNFEFNALNYDYLVINGARAQFRGTGKITGDQSGYGFIMTVIDGDLNGSGPDKVRMKIYNKNTGQVVYDNQPGAGDAADPVAAVGSNSSIQVSGASQNNLKINTETEMVMESAQTLQVIANPNPTRNDFILNIRSNDSQNMIQMQVVDMYGRLIETRKVYANSIIRVGEKYIAGIYFVKLVQDEKQQQVKLVKVE